MLCLSLVLEYLTHKVAYRSMIKIIGNNNSTDENVVKRRHIRDKYIYISCSTELQEYKICI